MPFDAMGNLRGIEDWLNELEKGMKETLGSIFRKALVDYKRCASFGCRKEWL